MKDELSYYFNKGYEKGIQELEEAVKTDDETMNPNTMSSRIRRKLPKYKSDKKKSNPSYYKDERLKI